MVTRLEVALGQKQEELGESKRLVQVGGCVGGACGCDRVQEPGRLVCVCV